MSISKAQPRQKPYRDRIADGIVALSKPVYFLLRRKRKEWATTVNDLEQMPKETLGHDLYLFLSKNQFSLMPKAEFHDVFHVLFNYGTTMRDETAIQFVIVGNGKWSLPNLVTTGISVVLYPDYWGHFFRSFQMGQNAKKFYHLNFETLLDKRTSFLQDYFGFKYP